MSAFSCPACHTPVGDHDLRCPKCAAPLPVRGAGAVQKGDALAAGTWSKITRVCGWCDAKTKDPRDENCDACGGPLPPLPPRVMHELNLGLPDWPEPPPAPRTLPKGYEFRVRYWKNTLVMIGIIFTVAFFWTVLFPIIGIGLWVVGHKKADRWIRALLTGTPVEGTITKVFLDTSQSINNQHPWQIDYRFETPKGRVEGHVNSWDALSGQRQSGERVWVVFDPKEPDTNALWPPVA